MFDYHVHSHFSADCHEQMEDMVIAAIDKGISQLCFTEHIDYEYPDDSIVFDIDFPAYTASIEQMRKQFGSKITILQGVEIGVQPHILDRYESLLQQTAFDFVICSMHTTDKKSLHYKEIFHDRSVEDAHRLYYEEYLTCIQQFKQFNVLGHVDLIKRYSDEPVTNLFHDELRAIFNELIPNGKGIELNTSGERYGLSHALPSPDVLALYRACGGEIITLGSDAHRVSELAFHFPKSLKLLDELGFRYITTFEAQQPTFHSIDQFL